MKRLSFLLNWYLNPYHIPIVVAKELGLYRKHNIELSLLEPTDPSDVTKIIGSGEIKLGLKAMIHCYAARSRSYKIKSIGTLLDEPPTGLISLKSSNIKQFSDLAGKRIGYVGEFGKVMIDNLAAEFGIKSSDYTAIRIGMNATPAIISGKVDAAIGLSCFQQLELEELGYPCNLLRIDELANLGCCCFCSILFIAHEDIIKSDPEIIENFMIATFQAMQFTRELPNEAYDCFTRAKYSQNQDINKKIFHHCLPFFSKELLNVERDWNKVGNYAKRLKLIEKDYDPIECYTNQFVENIHLHKPCKVAI